MASPRPVSPPHFIPVGADLIGDSELAFLFTFLDVEDTLSVSLASCAWRRAADHNSVWVGHCSRDWARRQPFFYLTPDRAAALSAAGRQWKEVFREARMDGQRAVITREELCAQGFDFRFRGHTSVPAATNFRFGVDGLTSGHPMGVAYPWVCDGRRIQWGPAGRPFPMGRVFRCTDGSWGWVVQNPNVVLEGHFDQPPDPASHSLAVPQPQAPPLSEGNEPVLVHMDDEPYMIDRQSWRTFFADELQMRTSNLE